MKKELKKYAFTLDKKSVDYIDSICEEYATNRSNALRIIIRKNEEYNTSLKAVTEFNALYKQEIGNQ